MRQRSGLHNNIDGLSPRRSLVMISACLLGVRCRYDGKHSACPGLLNVISSIDFIPFCPEQLGGLSTPRSPANIQGGDGYDVLHGNAVLINGNNEEVTDAFIKGAYEAHGMAVLSQCRIALMKGRSPSCGIKTPCREKPDGYGYGVTAALFEIKGISVFNLEPNDLFPSKRFFKTLKSVQI